MNDTLTNYAAVEFLMRLDTLDLQIKIAEEQEKIRVKNREALIYQGLCEMYRGRVHSKTVPTDVVEKLSLVTEYLEA